MPAKVNKLGGGRCSVTTPNGTKAKNTSCSKAKKQARLINAVDHGWKPTGKSAKESTKTLASNLLERLLGLDEAVPSNPDFFARDFDEMDWDAYGGAEEPDSGPPQIGSIVIDGMDGEVIADRNSVQVILYNDRTQDSEAWMLSTPHAQGRAIMNQVGRATSIQDLKELGFTRTI